MDYETDSDVVDRFDWEFLVKSVCTLVKFKEEAFVNPVEDEVENAGKWIKDRHPCAECEHAPQISVVLSVNIVA